MICNINNQTVYGAEPNDGEVYEDLLINGSKCSDTVSIQQGDVSIGMTDGMVERLIEVLLAAFPQTRIGAGHFRMVGGTWVQVHRDPQATILYHEDGWPNT